MPLTSAERQKRYRERLKQNNPIKWNEEKKKDADKKRRDYIKISELSETEKAKRRKIWRQLKQKQFLKHNDKPKKNSSRKIYKQRYYRITKENEKQKRKIDTLKKKVDSLRKRVYRYKLLLACTQNDDRDDSKENVEPSLPATPTSPISKTESFIQELKHVPSPEKDKIRRVVLEKNILSESLTNSYKNAESNAERNILKNVVNNAVVQKHKMKTRLGFCIGLKGRPRNTIRQKKNKYAEFASIIRDFYLQDDVSRTTAGKKETKTVKKMKMQKRYLLDNITNLYNKFKQDTGINLSYTTFLRNKPFYVVSPKLSDRDTCVCKKHSNIEFKFASLKRLSVLTGHKSINDLVKSLVCNSNSQQCMYGQCTICKNKLIPCDLTTITLDESVTWLEWSIKEVEYKNKDSIKKCKRNVKEIKTGTLQDLVNKFEQDLQDYKIHLYNIGHQYKMYKDMKDNLKTNEILLHCDFSENFTCKMFQEIQAVHFGASQYQISLHTSVIYQNNKKPQSYCTLSDATDHSPEAIWAHLEPILTHISEKSPEIDTLHVFSDGPTTQYRQKKNFFLFNKIIKDFGLTGTWNFFEAAHGKGAADGVGGVIKRLLDSKVAHGNDVLNAESAYNLLKKETSVKLFCIDEADINNIKEDHKASLLSLKAVPNTMKIHQIQTKNQSHNIASRFLSCFCDRSPKRGMCDCYNLLNHNLLKPTKRAKRLPSTSSESDNEKIVPAKCMFSTTRHSRETQNSRVTILSDVKVNYDRETLQTLIGSSKSYNIPTNNIRKDFMELITPDESLPSVSNTAGKSQNKRHNNFFFKFCDDSSDDSDSCLYTTK